MNSEQSCQQQAIQLSLEQEKSFVSCYCKIRRKTTSKVMLNDSTSPPQESMTTLIQTLSSAQILIPKKILLNKYLKLWKSDDWQ